jgi:mRNA-degrading endonuclease RelE of RelBE toxin-antitoxin system
MKSKLLPSFIEEFRALSPETRERVRRAYREWRENPNARRFKRVGEDVSARIDRNYRVLGFIDEETVFWYWVGKHDEYDQKI